METIHHPTETSMSTFTCISCSSKFCEKQQEGTFDICQYGISFLKRKGVIETREPKVPLSTIAKNLRHEINPILQTIIQQASFVDPTLSTKVIDTENPTSLIIGSTIVLDNFIQMITGVHEFHSSPTTLTSKKINLKSLIDLNYTAYGIIKENGRTKNLRLNNHIPNNFFISQYPDFIKYILVVLIDNAWKYSIDNSTLTVNINRISTNNYRLKLTNKSKIIPVGVNIFELGTKVDESSKGFGYGLHWVKTLENNYNELLQNDENEYFEVVHNQINSEGGLSFQEFILENIKIDQE